MGFSLFAQNVFKSFGFVVLAGVGKGIAASPVQRGARPKFTGRPRDVIAEPSKVEHAIYGV